MQEPKSGYVVSDICDTLFYSNTTFDFIRFCVEKEWLSQAERSRWKLLLRRQSPFFWVLAILNKLTKADHHKKVAVGLLKGYSVTVVKGWASVFYREYLKAREVEQAFALLQELADNTHLVLASSSIAPVVEEIADALHAYAYVATTLEVKDGIYTGNITLDLTGKKGTALKTLLGSSAPVAVISDNATDRSLMELADRGYAICYNESQRQFWSNIPGITLLDVGKKVA